MYIIQSLYSVYACTHEHYTVIVVISMYSLTLYSHCIVICMCTLTLYSHCSYINVQSFTYVHIDIIQSL